jgi:hypothetical protein
LKSPTRSIAAARPLAVLFVGVALNLGGCAGQNKLGAGGDQEINAHPDNYKDDIAAAMHAYLKDPTGLHDTAVSEPTLKSLPGGPQRYVACVRYTPKKTATVYDGQHEAAAVFLAGRFDQFIEPPKDLCAGATYASFPELGKLGR